MTKPDEDDARKFLELEREQWHRECRRNLLAFCVEALHQAGQVPARHHKLICEYLMRLVRCELPAFRLMIMAPPGSAKTTYVSRLFPAWYFAAYPRSSIISVSHIASLAETNSSYVQRFILENSEALGYSLRNEDKQQWFTDRGGEYRATGVGGTTRGWRADVLILDDPIKDRDAAESLIARENLWNYFHSDLIPRLKPTGAVILIGTPLHEDDLLCRLAREQADAWHILRLPAISEGDGDALDRPEGESLWADDDKYGYGRKLLELRDAAEREGRLSDWYAQYQGRPRPPEGAMFKPGQMRVYDLLPPRLLMTVRAWDLAATSSGDWTVGLKLSQCGHWQDDSWIVTDIRRMRGRPDEVRALFRAMVESDGYQVEQWLPQDPGQAGLDQAESYIRSMPNFRVKAERMTGDKVTRADSVACQVNIGAVGMLRAPWNAAFIDELGAFPRGVHDDQVDALSLAFSKLGNDPLLRWARLSG
jgi:predicted phage terminase large subunit-like protein